MKTEIVIRYMLWESGGHEVLDAWYLPPHIHIHPTVPTIAQYNTLTLYTVVYTSIYYVLEIISKISKNVKKLQIAKLKVFFLIIDIDIL